MTPEDYLNTSERLDLLKAITELIDASSQSDDRGFGNLALRVAQYQARRCAPFKRLCQARTGLASPAELDNWEQIPGVPTDAFKHFDMTCFPLAFAKREFQTSGTTRQTAGRHYFINTELYDKAAMKTFSAHLFPEIEHTQCGPGAKPIWIALTESPERAPHSSLVHMIATAARHQKAPVDYFVAKGEIKFDQLWDQLSTATDQGQPVLILSTAFALVHLLDEASRRDRALKLPPGSRMMETGGYKGRSREVSRTTLYHQVASTLGLSERRIINEYGMTELSSQFYDRALSCPEQSISQCRIKEPPPWVRVAVLNPETLAPVCIGERGVLKIVDLANLDSCAFIQTADLAVRHRQGFELLGRLPAAEARGCSLDYESMT